MNLCKMPSANTIKTLRRNHGMTQEDLAGKSGCGVATIQRAESGKSVSADTVASIAAAFGIAAIELTKQDQGIFEPFLPLDLVATGRSLVALLLGRSRIDFGFCELDNLDDAKEIELFHGFCHSVAKTDCPLSPITLVTRELEARDHLTRLGAHGFQVGGANFEITAYEIDDEGGGIGICYGQWDESCIALRVGRSREDVSCAQILLGLGKWETVKGDSVVYPLSPHVNNDCVTAADALSLQNEEEG
jgi:transcriptional regulator with XRE-family HTH domain